MKTSNVELRYFELFVRKCTVGCDFDFDFTTYLFLLCVLYATVTKANLKKHFILFHHLTLLQTATLNRNNCFA